MIEKRDPCSAVELERKAQKSKQIKESHFCGSKIESSRGKLSRPIFSPTDESQDFDRDINGLTVFAGCNES
jgi:hypothetical protein